MSLLLITEERNIEESSQMKKLIIIGQEMNLKISKKIEKQKFYSKERKQSFHLPEELKERYLEKAIEVIPKPKQAYITINRGTKRILVDLK